MRFTVDARGLLQGLKPPAAPPSLSEIDRVAARARISVELGGVDASAGEAIGRLLDVAGLEFVSEVLARTLLTEENPRSIHPCGGRLRTFLRIAQRNLSHDAWRIVGPRRAVEATPHGRCSRSSSWHVRGDRVTPVE